MRIMWLSVAPWVNTGYGNQTATFVPRLKAAGHEIAVSGTTGLKGTILDWNGVTVYPEDHTSLNKRSLKHHILREYGKDADDVQVISLWDIWPWVDPAYGGMVADFDGLNIASWVPVDSWPVTPKTLVAIDKWDVRTIGMSRFGQQQLQAAGYDALYVPHGIDTSVYRPHEDREASRELTGIPKDRFVIGMVAFNAGISPPRKAFPQVLQAFAEFRRRHDDAFLYMHSEMVGVHDGLNLMGLAQIFGIPPESMGYPPQIQLLESEITGERMSHLYSSMDVLVNPSYGEGFGIPIVEAQACGTPVIVSSWTSMPELCGSGWQVGGQPWYNPASGAYWGAPDTEEIIEAFEAAYAARGDQELRVKAREFALQYDADRVFQEHWVPTLEALEAPREVPPLRPIGPNRAQRRAALKAAA